MPLKMTTFSLWFKLDRKVIQNFLVNEFDDHYFFLPLARGIKLVQSQLMMLHEVTEYNRYASDFFQI